MRGKDILQIYSGMHKTIKIEVETMICIVSWQRAKVFMAMLFLVIPEMEINLPGTLARFPA